MNIRQRRASRRQFVADVKRWTPNIYEIVIGGLVLIAIIEVMYHLTLIIGG